PDALARPRRRHPGNHVPIGKGIGYARTMLTQRTPAAALRGRVTSYSGYAEETGAPLRRREGPGADVVPILSLEHDWLIDGGGRARGRVGLAGRAREAGGRARGLAGGRARREPHAPRRALRRARRPAAEGGREAPPLRARPRAGRVDAVGRARVRVRLLRPV